MRSLNLASSVAVGLYEALRQLDGPVLPGGEEEEEGEAQEGEGQEGRPSALAHEAAAEAAGGGEGERRRSAAEAALIAAGRC